MRRRSGGTTLLEMLLAGALLGLLLVATGAAQVTALEASAAGEEAAFRGQVTELATELLQYHVGLAGYRGVSTSLELSGAALALGRGSGAGGGDALAVGYVEERWYENPTVRRLRFDVRRDGTGRWNLYQQEAGSTRQPAVQEVSRLEVIGLVTPDGNRLNGDASLPVEVAVLELELEFTWGARRSLTVALPRPVSLVAEAP